MHPTFYAVPYGKIHDVAAMLEAIQAQEDLESARETAVVVAEKQRSMKLSKASNKVETSIEETLIYTLPNRALD